MEDLLGISYLGLNDANAEPMSDHSPIHSLQLLSQVITAPWNSNLMPACSDPNANKGSNHSSLHSKQW